MDRDTDEEISTSAINRDTGDHGGGVEVSGRWGMAFYSYSIMHDEAQRIIGLRRSTLCISSRQFPEAKHLLEVWPLRTEQVP